MFQKNRSIFRVLLIIIAVPVMIFLSSCTAYRRIADPNDQYQYGESPYAQHQQAPQTKRDMSQIGSIAEVAAKLVPSVVGISTTTVQEGTGLGQDEIIQGVGSGVIVDPNGYILTNDHVVVSKNSEITVILHNGDELPGKVLWTDPTLDLAIVKVNATGLPAAELGDSEQLVVGEPAIAVGTPLGLQFQHTTTFGIISALDRTVQVPTVRGENFMEDLIQTDASINPGNSGGPLSNINGQVIGINTIKVESAEAIGFAIPIDVAKPIIQHIVEDGRFETPYIGIVGFDKEMASYFKKSDGLQNGIYVADIDPRGPAYRGGIRVDDIITQVDDQKVSKMLDLRKAIYKKHIGEKVTMTVIRQGRQNHFDITLQESRVAE